MADICAFVLTVDAVGGVRRSNAERELGNVGVPFVFVEGANSSDPQLAAAYSPFLNLLLQKRSLSPAEIAIYEGHRRIWREVLARGLEMALVVEDDVKFLDRSAFLAAVANLTDIRDSWDIVKFFDYRPKKIVQAWTCGTTRLVAYKYPASGAVAYLINARAAAALLRRKRVFRPVDEDFSHPWEFSLRIWSTHPNLADEVSGELGGSITEKDRYKERKRRKLSRSIWGNVLQLSKLVCSHAYRWKQRAAIGGRP